MFAPSSKILALAVASMSFLPTTWACLQLSGTTKDGFAVGGSISAKDNGVVTCSGDIGSGDHYVSKYT